MKVQLKLCSMLISLWIVTNAFAADESDKKAIQKVSAAFSQLCQANQFSGVALIAIDGKIQFEKACGLASREFHAPNTIQTQFNLGSVSKLFTIVAIGQLIEEEKLSLNTVAATVLPTWLPMSGGNDISIEQLLTHRSGLGNFMDDKRWQLGADSGLFNDTDKYEPLIQAETLRFKSGASQAYSNSAYVVLGKIIETVSGKSYSHYIAQNIFSKANMAHTGLHPLDEVVENRATGYYYSCKKNPCLWKNNNYEVAFMGNSAGGAYSTAGDLFKFSQALYRRKLLNQSLTLQILSSTVLPLNKGTKIKKIKIGDSTVLEALSPYGFAGVWNALGVAVWDSPKLVGHTGGGLGASALLMMSPDNHYTIVLLSNIDAGTLRLYQRIRESFNFKQAVYNY